MQNITLSADERDIASAREKARARQTSLNALFREWLRSYVSDTRPAEQFDQVMERFSAYSPGGKFTREEMNER